MQTGSPGGRGARGISRAKTRERDFRDREKNLIFSRVADGLDGADCHKGDAAQLQDPIQFETQDPPFEEHADVVERCGAHDDEEQ